MLLPRRAVRRLLALAAASFLAAQVLWLLLPSDNIARLAIRFNAGRALGFLRGPGTARDAWLWRPARFAVDPATDVALLIKTGYGTRERLPAQLEALGLHPDRGDAFVVVGDFSQANRTAQEARVYDAVGGMLGLKGLARLENSPRFMKYRFLAEAIEEENEERAREVARSFGWELDAMKFIWGLEMVYEKLPLRKWYIILDDDTYLIKPSLQLILSHLDPAQPHYFGNAVGDFKGRFAHGGSAVILSGEAVHKLFAHPDIVAEAHINALTEIWGDRLMATTLQKVGVYLDERYAHFFNGERPAATRLAADRFCSPLLSFHGLTRPDEMRQVGVGFGRLDQPVAWGQLWALHGAPPLDGFAARPVRAQQDFVGRGDEHSRTIGGVESAEECLRRCERDARHCLAWTWEESGGACHLAPWMVVGDKPEGKFSGVNWRRALGLAKDCLG